MRRSQNRNSYPCPRCTVGRCLPQTQTYVDIYQGQLLSVPDMPNHVCDVCHYSEFEIDAVESLWDMLDYNDYADNYPSSNIGTSSSKMT